MPWLSVDYKANALSKVSRFWNVQALPHLIIINRNNEVLNEDAVGVVTEMGPEIID